MIPAETRPGFKRSGRAGRWGASSIVVIPSFTLSMGSWCSIFIPPRIARRFSSAVWVSRILPTRMTSGSVRRYRRRARADGVDSGIATAGGASQ
jgi:hypothetical protein